MTLKKGATVVTLPDPSLNSDGPTIRPGATGLTAGGTRYGYDKGVPRYEVRLGWTSLTSAQKVLVDAFFAIVLGMKDTWTLTDWDTNSWTARFLAPRLQWRKVMHNVWDLDVDLELDGVWK